MFFRRRVHYGLICGPRDFRRSEINPIVTSASSAGDIRGRKTDKRDAESIAEVVLRGKYACRRDEGLQERKLRALTRQRGFIVEGDEGSDEKSKEKRMMLAVLVYPTLDLWYNIER